MKDEKLQYFWGSRKNSSFRGFTKNEYVRGLLPKKGGLRQFTDLRGCLARKRERGAFEGWWGVDTPMHTMEKIMLKRILDYIQKYLSPHLCGYKKWYSTLTSLISMLEKWRLSIDNNGWGFLGFL